MSFVNTRDVIGDLALADSIIDRTVTEIADDMVTGQIGAYSFYKCDTLTSVDFPNANSVGTRSFEKCTSLTTVNMPKLNFTLEFSFSGCTSLSVINMPLVDRILTSSFENCTSLTNAVFTSALYINGNAFKNCTNLINVDMPLIECITSYAFYSCIRLPKIFFPNVTEIEQYSFAGCTRLVSADFPLLTNIKGNQVFMNNYSLTTFILRSETICTLDNYNSFSNCYHILGTVDANYNPTGAKDGYIYVPSALIEDYKVATNWRTYATQFRALEDYTVDGTTTGALDETKI